MKNINKCLIMCLPLLLFKYSDVLACTNISLTAKDGTVVVGRTMEFELPLESNVVTSPKGKKFTTKDANGNPTMQWTSKYGYVYLNAFKQFDVDGMNTEGLSFGYLYLPGETEYMPESNVKSINLPYTMLADWVLGNFSSVKEVKTALKRIIVYDLPKDVAGYNNLTFPLHAIIFDKTGAGIVVEFINGKMYIHNAPSGVLTNSPTYDWQVNNLRNYISLSPYSPEPVMLDGIIYTSTGIGSGMLGLPGDYSPPSRFAKVSILKKAAMQTADATTTLNLAEHILNNVDIPYGVVRNKPNDFVDFNSVDKTQWTVFKDLRHNKLYFKSYYNQNLQMIDLNRLNLSANGKVLHYKIDQPQKIDDATKQMH